MAGFDHTDPDYNGPGGRTCDLMFQAWSEGFRDQRIVAHIDDCWWCKWLILGENTPEIEAIVDNTMKTLTDKIERDREREEEERRVASRRRFVRVAAGMGGVAAIVGSTLGIRAMFFGGSTPHEQARTRSDGELDRIYHRRGVTGISDMLQGASTQEKQRIAGWIGNRQQAPLFAVLIGIGSDPDPQTRNTAISALILIPPIQLQPHLAALQALESAETNQGIKTVLQALVVAVQNA